MNSNYLEGAIAEELLSGNIEKRNEALLLNNIEKRKMIEIGIMMGAVDSLFPEENKEINLMEICELIFILKMSKGAALALPMTYVPSGEQIKSFIMWTSGVSSEAELEQNLIYLESKYRTEFAIMSVMMVIGGKELLETIAHAQQSVIAFKSSITRREIVVERGVKK